MRQNVVKALEECGVESKVMQIYVFIWFWPWYVSSKRK